MDFDVYRCWKQNPASAIMRGCLRRFATASPTLSGSTWFFSSFGNKENPLAAFSGLTLPATTRMAGFYTHVTLHHLMDHIHSNDAGVRVSGAAGNIATRTVLMANSVSVLLPAYRRTPTKIPG